jgi:hypothetical protein
MNMPISSLKFCKKQKCMEKFQNLYIANNPYMFLPYYTPIENNTTTIHVFFITFLQHFSSQKDQLVMLDMSKLT